MPNYTIAVLADAIQVLESFLNGRSQLTLTDVVRETGLSKNKAFRILSTLERHRLVERVDGQGYRLGVRFLEFGQRVQRQMSLLEAARETMDQLVQETQESVFLGIIDEDQALCVDMRESPHSIRLFAEVGRRAPLYAGGVPKVLLAFLPPAERGAVLGRIRLEPITSKTVTSRAELERILKQIQEDGHLVATDDLDLGAHSIAAPIRDQRGQVVAAISVAGPSSRFDPQRIERYVSLVTRGAEEISRRLGYRPRQAGVPVPSPPTAASPTH